MIRHVIAAGLAAATMMLAGCLATENPDFRSVDAPSGFGSSAGQSERGSTVLNRGSSPDSNASGSAFNGE